MLIKVGKFGPFHRCSAYPECTNTASWRRTSLKRGRARGDRALRRTAEADGREARPLRPVPGVLRVSECKTTRKLVATKQGGLRAAKPDQILDEPCPRCGR